MHRREKHALPNKYRKRCPTWHVWIKSLPVSSIGQHEEKWRLLFLADLDVNWNDHFEEHCGNNWKSIWSFLSYSPVFKTHARLPPPPWSLLCIHSDTAFLKFSALFYYSLERMIRCLLLMAFVCCLNARVVLFCTFSSLASKWELNKCCWFAYEKD